MLKAIANSDFPAAYVENTKEDTACEGYAARVILEQAEGSLSHGSSPTITEYGSSPNGNSINEATILVSHLDPKSYSS